MLSNRPTKVIIDLKNYRSNLAQIRQRIGNKTKLLLVLKADASGCGALELARVAEDSGADYIGVAFVDEAIALRQGGITLPILVFSSIVPQEIEPAIQHNLSLTLSKWEDFNYLTSLARRRKITVHVKVDTGMNRAGFRPNEIATVCQQLVKMEHITVEGLYTHFASAHSGDASFTYEQFNQFKKAIAELSREDIEIPVKHVSNSGAILNFPELTLDMVRISALSLGFTFPYNRQPQENFRPIFNLRTEVVSIRDVPAGNPVSYDQTYRVRQDSVIATLPVGYGDGYCSLLSNKGRVLVRGQYASIVGRICMDQMMVDTTDIPEVRLGDEVILVGEQEGRAIPLDEVAGHCGFIHAEFASRISARVPRLYIDKNSSRKQCSPMFGDEQGSQLGEEV